MTEPSNPNTLRSSRAASSTPPEKKSIGELITDIPKLLTRIVSDEIESFKRELTGKAAKLGVGVGLIVVAAVFLFFATGSLIAAAILGIATALPAWLAALIVAAALIAIAVILVLIAVMEFKKNAPPIPEETLTSIHKDINAVKGLGQK